MEFTGKVALWHCLLLVTWITFLPLRSEKTKFSQILTFLVNSQNNNELISTSEHLLYVSITPHFLRIFCFEHREIDNEELTC